MYKKIFIPFILLFLSTVLLTGTSFAITLTASPNPATLNKTVTFKIGINFTAGICNSFFINYGDGTAPLALGNVTQDTILQAAHTYTRAGIYTVTSYTNCATVANRNPVTLVLRVSDFEIKRIETTFENGEPQVTLQRNEPAPGLSAKITFSGSGLLKGYWEVDGDKGQHFFKHLSIGPETIIQYPKTPTLKTFIPGSHIVRFVITEPTLDIAFPKLVYYVTPEDFLKISNIKILTPRPNEILKFEPFTFTWQNIPATTVYLINIFSEKKDIPVFSAYAIKNNYTLKTDFLNKFLEPGKSYSVQILGFLEDTRMSGKSEIIPLSLKK